LQAAGINAVREFKSKPSAGDVLIVSNSGTTCVYVIGHDKKLIHRLVKFLQEWENTGVIFTRDAMPGTFALKDVRIDSADAPDIVVSMRWSAGKNKVGIAGMVTADVTGFVAGQGLHVSLSPFDMHNTLIATGPDFRSGVKSSLASGNVDIAPTILWILGIKSPQKMDGRILSEALTIRGPKLKSFEPRFLEAKSTGEKTNWRQYLNFSEVNGVVYFDEGNGEQIAK